VAAGKRVAIIDYGMGNLGSVKKGLERVGIKAIVTSEREDVEKADGVILPGVGAFEDAINNLRIMGLTEAVREAVASKKPFLGICLGMQLLFDESEENGLHKGLGLIKGRVVRLPSKVKIPHMGWNQVKLVKKSPLFVGVPDESYFYFVHSYYCFPEEDVAIGKTFYGLDFVCAVQKENILATQFHPEKSSKLGLAVLLNFARLVEGQANDNISSH